LIFPVRVRGFECQRPMMCASGGPCQVDHLVLVIEDAVLRVLTLPRRF